MTFLSDVKVSLRVSSDATDSEIRMWIDAALGDMARVGVREELLDQEDPESMPALVRAAVACYVKANYGYDVDERPQFEDSYRRIVCGLMNSPANASAGGSDG